MENLERRMENGTTGPERSRRLSPLSSAGGGSADPKKGMGPPADVWTKFGGAGRVDAVIYANEMTDGVSHARQKGPSLRP